jgi:membrane protein DedA with SNARE-associated domain
MALTLHHMASILALDPAVMERIVAFSAANRPWILPLVFVIGLLKSTPVIAVFVPSTAMFIALAAAYNAGGGAFVPLWLAATAGATSGDVIFYGLGHRYRHGITKVWPLSRTPELFARGEAIFVKWGTLSVFAGKFVWGIRPFIPLIAGMYQMRFILFLAVTNLSSLIWAAIGMGAGYGAWQLWK